MRFQSGVTINLIGTLHADRCKLTCTSRIISFGDTVNEILSTVKSTHRFRLIGMIVLAEKRIALPVRGLVVQ